MDLMMAAVMGTAYLGVMARAWLTVRGLRRKQLRGEGLTGGERLQLRRWGTILVVTASCLGISGMVTALIVVTM